MTGPPNKDFPEDPRTALLRHWLAHYSWKDLRKLVHIGDVTLVATNNSSRNLQVEGVVMYQQFSIATFIFIATRDLALLGELLLC